MARTLIDELSRDIMRIQNNIAEVNKQIENRRTSLTDLFKILEDIELNIIIIQNKFLRLKGVQKDHAIYQAFTNLQSDLNHLQIKILDRSKIDNNIKSDKKDLKSDRESTSIKKPQGHSNQVATMSDKFEKAAKEKEKKYLNTLKQMIESHPQPLHFKPYNSKQHKPKGAPSEGNHNKRRPK